MNLNSQNNTNYQNYIGQHYNMSDTNDLLSINSFSQEQQINTNYNSFNEQLKQSVNRENECEENDFENNDLSSKLDNSDSKRQKKNSLEIVAQQKSNYYQGHYNQSITGSSISSNSSSTSSSPLSLSSPLHTSNIHFNHHNNHLNNLQLKQPLALQSQPILAVNNSLNYQPQQQHHLSQPIQGTLSSQQQQQQQQQPQTFLYNDSNANNLFSYHSINKVIPIIENNNQPFSLHTNNDMSENSNLDEFNGGQRIKIKKSKRDPITEYDTELAESIEFELGLKKQNGPRKNSWGNLSYAELITRAIESSCDQRLTLSQIYDWIVKYVPYFKEKFDRTSSAGWKNSIRHNLSLHNRFIRVQNESSGKSSWWMINPDITKYSLNPMNTNGSIQSSDNTDLTNFNEQQSSIIDNIDMKLSNMDYNKLDLTKTSTNNKSEMKQLGRRSNSSMTISQQKQDRLSPLPAYSATSSTTLGGITKNSSDLNTKRNKISKHKLGMSKLNKNNLIHKNKMKSNKQQDTTTNLSNTNLNSFDIKIENTTKCDTNNSSASSSSTASSSSSLSENNLSTVNISFQNNADNTDSSKQILINDSITDQIQSSVVSYQNLTNTNSSSILRAALQKSVSNNNNNNNNNMNNITTLNPPTPTATPTSFNNSKQFHNNNNNNNGFLQLQTTNPYSFNQTDNLFGYPVYQSNSSNSVQQQQQQQQPYSIQNTQLSQQIQNTPIYTTNDNNNNNNYFTGLNNQQMIVPSPGSSISSSSSSPSSSTSSSSSSTSSISTLTYLNRNTQILKSKSPLALQQDQYNNNNNNNYNLTQPQMQAMNTNQLYHNLNTNTFNNNNQLSYDTNQRTTTTTTTALNSNNIIFSPLTTNSTKSTYYDLNKNIQLQQTVQNSSNNLVANNCGGLMYDDLMYDNSNKATISCYYD